MKIGFLKFFFATFISLTSILPAFASDGVTLTGSVTGVTVQPKYDADGKDRYYFRVHVILQFKNEGNESVILLRPEGFYGTKRLAFTNDYSSDSMSVVDAIEFRVPEFYPSSKFTRNPSERDKIGDFLQELAGKEPRNYVFAVIPPNGYYECRDYFSVQNGFKTREVPNKNPKDRPEIIAIPEFSGFRIEYQLSVGDRPQGMDLLEDAKRKWSKFGNMIFDSDGKYSVKSGLILNMPSN